MCKMQFRMQHREKACYQRVVELAAHLLVEEMIERSIGDPLIYQHESIQLPDGADCHQTQHVGMT